MTQDLMERVVHPSNLNAAYRRVKANQGAAGIDGMTADELRPWLITHKGQLIEQLVINTRLRLSLPARTSMPIAMLLLKKENLLR